MLDNRLALRVRDRRGAALLEEGVVRQLLHEAVEAARSPASHQFAHTLRELRALDAMMTGDGVIMGDDWHVKGDHPHHGVLQAVHAFVAESDWRITAAGPGLQWAIRRLPYAAEAPAGGA